MGYNSSGIPQSNPDIATLVEMIHEIKDVFYEVTENFPRLAPDPIILVTFEPPFARKKFMTHMEQVLMYIDANSQQDYFLEKLEEHGMVGEELQYKKRNLELFIDIFLNHIRSVGPIAKRVIEPLLQIINSILESLGFIPGAGAAKEIKDHLHAAVSAST